MKQILLHTILLVTLVMEVTVPPATAQDTATSVLIDPDAVAPCTFVATVMEIQTDELPYYAVIAERKILVTAYRFPNETGTSSTQLQDRRNNDIELSDFDIGQRVKVDAVQLLDSGPMIGIKIQAQ